MKKLLICLSTITLFSCTENKQVESAETTPNEEITKTEQAPVTVQEQPTTTTETALSTKTLNGNSATVTKAKVIGKVLYVEIKIKNMGGSSLHVMSVKDINYIDDAEAKKHEVLKDDEGVYQASPLQSSKSNRLQINPHENEEELISLRFAAPPETSETITLNLPIYGSFDAIPINR